MSITLLEFTMRSSARVTSLVLVGLVVLPVIAIAAEQYTFWIGDTKDGANRAQPLMGCRDAHQAAQAICTVNQPDGLKRLYQYTLTRISSQGGGKCGYTKYEVSCYAMPAISGNRKHTFSVGELSDTYGCEADLFKIGRNFCTLHGPSTSRYPFTTRVIRAKDGGRCGSTEFELTCREPFPPQITD